MRKFVALIVVVAAVCAAWSGGWLWGATEIDRALAQLEAADGESEPRLSCGRRGVSGFPFRFDIACEEAVLVSGDVTATLAGLRATFLAYNPTQTVFSALGPMSLRDAYSGTSSRLEFSGLQGSARVVTDDVWQGLAGKGWRIGRVSVVADDIVWVDTVLEDSPILLAARAEAHLIDMPERHDPAAGVSALAAYANLAEATAPALEIADGEATVEAEVTGLPDDLTRFGDPDLPASWREAGGTLRLVGLRARAGEDYVESTATLGLDSGARLDGQVSVKSRGVVERLGNLVPEDWKPILIGRQAEDGSYTQTLNIKAGIVFAGLIPVGIVPPLM